MDVALDTYADARAPVPPLASGVVAGDPNQRRRFQVELVPGETTLVSWKKLVREANNEVVDADENDDEVPPLASVVVADDPNERQVEPAPGETTLVQEAKNEVPEDDDSGDDSDWYRKESSKSSNVRKKTRKEITDSVTSAALQKLQEKKSTQHNSQSRSLIRKSYEQEGFTNIKQRNNKGRNKLSDLNLPYPEHALVLTETPTESSSSSSSASTTSLLASRTVSSTKQESFRLEPVLLETSASGWDHQQQHQRQAVGPGLEHRHKYLRRRPSQLRHDYRDN